MLWWMRYKKISNIIKDSFNKRDVRDMRLQQHNILPIAWFYRLKKKLSKIGGILYGGICFTCFIKLPIIMKILTNEDSQ